MPLPEDIPLMLPPSLEKMIQLPEPIKEVNEMLPIPLNSYHYDEDEDLPQPDSINHTKHTEDWMNVRMPEPTPFSNNSYMSVALEDTNKDQSRMDQFLLPSPQLVSTNITDGTPLEENLDLAASQLSVELDDSTPQREELTPDETAGIK